MGDDRIYRRYETRRGQEELEIKTPQMARDMAANRALPLSNSERDDLRRVADKLEQREEK